MNRTVQKTFVTGDKWLYYKIYTGSKTADIILISSIKPLVEFLLKKKIIDKWFFIRYADPQPHLRLRFYCNEVNKINEVITILGPVFKELLKQDLIWKVTTDTYQRELERYGKNTIELSENIFFLNSSLILNILMILENDEELRWIFSLREIDNLLTNFKYSNYQKFQLLEFLKTSMAFEFGATKDLNKQLDLKYRKYRYKIENILNSNGKEIEQFEDINYYINCFNENSKETIDTILSYEESKTLEISLNNLLSSYIHMSMVRLFKSKNRMHEMVIYDFLFRYYKSKKAIDNIENNKKIHELNM
ncbi:thiopeptide-type bacteriocin biosynthesis protein [Flavobacterium sp. HJJ]|uniref:thiopeptide-type bacteriocin biosynthesis protein n=1 Tax=Flavobacterium sp. HJJ TaxID=2783792 RepID=UPI00188AD2B7|nr:thiopeptide-type bacteriocin biosynthesis protein [Flavobacterium sp. HJJ]MBF4472438.1 thiopeptide-type bacteriocin biosynthesis protein [Flavobacterium sp. HJJ]